MVRQEPVTRLRGRPHGVRLREGWARGARYEIPVRELLREPRPEATTVLPVTNGVIRMAQGTDVRSLVELREHMFAAMGVTSPDPTWRENAYEWFSSRLDDPNYHFAVVEVDGTVVACAVGAVRDAAPSPAAPEGRDVLVNNVSTAPPFRGRGYGRMAFDSVMVWARELGIRRAELMATAVRRGMYERAGFRDTQFPAMRARLG
jgi:GNAT superfamily N-acetyltransferase